MAPGRGAGDLAVPVLAGCPHSAQMARPGGLLRLQVRVHDCQCGLRTPPGQLWLLCCAPVHILHHCLLCGKQLLIYYVKCSLLLVLLQIHI